MDSPVRESGWQHDDGCQSVGIPEENPVANPQPDDFEPDGTWYSMIAVNGDLYAIEPNHGELDAIETEGEIRRVLDISNIQGHIVPTAMAFDGNDFFIGNLDTFPIKDGSSEIMMLENTTGNVHAFSLPRSSHRDRLAGS